MATISELRLVRFFRAGGPAKLDITGASIMRKLWHALNDIRGQEPLRQWNVFDGINGKVVLSEIRFGEHGGFKTPKEHEYCPEGYAAICLKDYELYVNPDRKTVAVGLVFSEISEESLRQYDRENLGQHAREKVMKLLRDRLPEITVRQVAENKNKDIKPHLNGLRSMINAVVVNVRGNRVLSSKVDGMAREFVARPYYDLLLEVELTTRYGD